MKNYYLFAYEDIYDKDQRIYAKHELIGNLKEIKEIPKGHYYIKEKQSETLLVEIIDHKTSKVIKDVKVGLFNYSGELIYEFYSGYIQEVPSYGTFYVALLEDIEGYNPSRKKYPLNKRLTILIEPTHLIINLLDQENNYLKGRHLYLYEEDLLFDEWMTNKAHHIYYLKINKRYRIIIEDETKAFIFKENTNIINIKEENNE